MDNRSLFDIRKHALEVAPTTCDILVDRDFSTGCYLLTVSNPGLLFIDGALTGFHEPTFIFQPIDCTCK